MLGRAHILRTEEGSRVSKMFTVAWKKYEQIYTEIFASAAGGSELIQ